MSKKVKDELLDHDYDGIKEFDNDLPPWWIYLFYVTILFSVVYIARYHVIGSGASQEEEYLAEMKEGEAVRKKAEAAQGMVQLAFSSDAAVLEKGKAIFTANCAACHGQNGEGLVGPNLTDDHYLHGNTIDEVVRVIKKGVPEKGMIPWEASLKPAQILEVASYIHSLHGSNPANPKEPQGELIAN